MYLANDLDRPCWYCVHWAGPCWGDPSMADCRRDGHKSCKADAARGCVHWMRETGVDDDGWFPPPLVRPKSPEQRVVDAAAIECARQWDRAHSVGRAG